MKRGPAPSGCRASTGTTRVIIGKAVSRRLTSKNVVLPMLEKGSSSVWLQRHSTTGTHFSRRCCLQA